MLKSLIPVLVLLTPFIVALFVIKKLAPKAYVICLRIFLIFITLIILLSFVAL